MRKVMDGYACNSFHLGINGRRLTPVILMSFLFSVSRPLYAPFVARYAITYIAFSALFHTPRIAKFG